MEIIIQLRKPCEWDILKYTDDRRVKLLKTCYCILDIVEYISHLDNPSIWLEKTWYSECLFRECEKRGIRDIGHCRDAENYMRRQRRRTFAAYWSEVQPPTIKDMREDFPVFKNL